MAKNKKKNKIYDKTCFINKSLRISLKFDSFQFSIRIEIIEYRAMNLEKQMQ